MKKQLAAPSSLLSPPESLAAILAASQGDIPALSHVTVLAVVQYSSWLPFSHRSGSGSSSTVALFRGASLWLCFSTTPPPLQF